jgi:protease-4
VLAVVFGGLFLVLFGFLLLAYSAVRSVAPGFDGESSGATSGARLALVELRGMIGDTQNGIDEEKVIRQLRKLEKDDDIKGVLVRIDSPGGAVAPSQEIYRTLRKLRAKKKVVASMGSLAASGGYYVAAAADLIFANPGTLTGSIGVISMHFNVRGLMEAVKVEETTFKSGKYKDTLSPFRPVTDQDREEMQGLNDDVYGQFIQDVAEGRGMKPDEVRAVADGRIYTGRRAKELKLVDELGSLDDATNKAWELCGQTGEAKLQLPRSDKEFGLRDLLRSSIEGAFRGALSGVVPGGLQDGQSWLAGGAAGASLRGWPGQAAPMLLAPQLLESSPRWTAGALRLEEAQSSPRWTAGALHPKEAR